MARKILITGVLIAAFAGSSLWKRALTADDAEDSQQQREEERSDGIPRNRECNRIVSLAPSITESLFALGLGDSVVGVTRYCDYPPAAQGKSQVGGYYDPNYEAIAALRPDIVVLFPEHERSRELLAKTGTKTLVVDHKSISDIINTLQKIGRTCKREQRAADIVRDLRQRLDSIRHKTAKLSRPSVMVSVGRNMGSGKVEDIYITGTKGLYHEMIALAGGVNAYEGNIAFPAISHEGIMLLDPEVIIDMIPDLKASGWKESNIIEEWHALKDVRAVKKERVHIFGQDFVVIPGPRFILILEQLSRVLHPEIW